MARTPRDVTNAELDVLQVLWDRGPSSVRQIVEALYPEGTAAQVATVQKLLERLEKNKGYVERDRSGPVQLFRATLGRDELIGRRLESIAKELCEGSLTPLLTHLVRDQRLTPEELRSLRELIDELGAQRPRNDRPRRGRG
ncbi:MAG TPA: BlaI/MecI/CopY family transcriptional regulator [Gemmataceae bacterium]